MTENTKLGLIINNYESFNEKPEALNEELRELGIPSSSRDLATLKAILRNWESQEDYDDDDDDE